MPSGQNALHRMIAARDWASSLEWIDWYKVNAPGEVTALALRAMVFSVQRFSVSSDGFQRVVFLVVRFSALTRSPHVDVYA